MANALSIGIQKQATDILQFTNMLGKVAAVEEALYLKQSFMAFDGLTTKRLTRVTKTTSSFAWISQLQEEQEKGRKISFYSGQERNCVNFDLRCPHSHQAVGNDYQMVTRLKNGTFPSSFDESILLVISSCLTR